MTTQMPDAFFVGEYFIERKLNRITINGNEQIVEPRVMELLYYFACHAGQVISRQQIMSDVWASKVSDGAVNRVIGLLRKVLADPTDDPQYIQTVAKQGYRFIAVVRFEKQVSDSPLTKNNATVGKYIKASVVAAIIVICILLLLIWQEFQPKKTASFTINNPQFELLTSAQGFEYDASLSQDEQWLVYRHRANTEQPYHLYLKKRQQQQTIQLTQSRFNDRSPSFSHDKHKIIFFRKGQGTCHLNLLTLNDVGEPLTLEEIHECGAIEHYSNVVWAPDDQSIYFTDRANSAAPYQIYRLNLNTFKVDEITAKEDNYYGDNELALSPSGRQLLFFRNKYWGNNQVFIKDLASGEQRKIAELGFLSWNPSWTPDEQSIIFSDNRVGGKLNRLDIASGENYTLYQSAQAINSPELSPSGKYLVYATEKADADLWQIDLTKSPLEKLKVPFNSSQLERQPQYSKDAQSLLFISNRNGAMQLWLKNDKGLTAIDSLPELMTIDGYAWHPDGKQVAVVSGEKRLYLVDLVKDSTEFIDLKEQSAAYPTFSSEGNQLYFTSDKSGDWQLWSLDMNNHVVKQITDKGGYQVKQGALADQLYFTKYRKDGIWLLDVTNNSETLVVEHVQRNSQFKQCGSALYYLLESENVELWKSDLQGAISQKLMSMPLNSKFEFDLTDNCQTLIFSKWDNIGSDIVMMNLN